MHISSTVTGYIWTLRDLAAGLFRTSRPLQWTKNAFVLAPLLFSARITQLSSISLGILATLAFTLMAIATYFWNDVADRSYDKVHPVKRYRPIAAGEISVNVALTVAVISAVLGLAIGLSLGIGTAVALLAYLALQLTYTLYLKHRAIADVMCIALGFELRVIVGALAIAVVPSEWLLLCTLFLATFLGFAKRYGEEVRLVSNTDRDGISRPVLVIYNNQFLFSLLSITCALTMLSYALYVVERQPPSLVLLGTIPVVAYALFRYLLLVLSMNSALSSESPERLLFRDHGLAVSALVWLIMCVVAVLTSPVVKYH